MSEPKVPLFCEIFTCPECGHRINTIHKENWCDKCDKRPRMIPDSERLGGEEKSFFQEWDEAIKELGARSTRMKGEKE